MIIRQFSIYKSSELAIAVLIELFSSDELESESAAAFSDAVVTSETVVSAPEVILCMVLVFPELFTGVSAVILVD